MDANVIVVFHVSESEEIVRLMDLSYFRNMTSAALILKLLTDFSISIANPIMYFTNFSFSFPLLSNVDPVKIFPQLGLINKYVDIHDRNQISKLPRLEVFQSSECREENIYTYIYQKSNLKNRIVMKCPFVLDQLGLYIIQVFVRCIKEFVWKNFVDEIFKNYQISENDLCLIVVENDKEKIFSYDNQLTISNLNLIEQNGTFIFEGVLYFDDKKNLTKLKTFNNSKNKLMVYGSAEADSFFGELSNEVKDQISKFQDDIMAFFSSNDLSRFFHFLVPRISQMLCSDSYDEKIAIGLKCILTPFLIDLFSSFLNKVDCSNVNSWKEICSLFSSKKNSCIIEDTKMTERKEILSKPIVFNALSLNNFIDHIVDIPLKLNKYFKYKEGMGEYNFFGPVIYYTYVFLESDPYTLVLTRGFIYLIEGKLNTTKSYEFLPQKFVLDSGKNYYTLPILSSIPFSFMMNKRVLCFLVNDESKLLIDFVNSEQMLDFVICFHYCYNELNKAEFTLNNPKDTSISLKFENNLKIKASVRMNKQEWNVEFGHENISHLVSSLRELLYYVPSSQTVHTNVQKKQKIQVCGCNIQIEKLMNIISSESNFLSDVAFIKGIIVDLLFSYSQRARFQCLYLLKISDFSQFLDPDILKTQIHIFPSTIIDFKVDNLLFFHYVCKYCKDPEIVKILFEVYPINLLDDSLRTALFYSIDNQNTEITQALIDNNIDINRCNNMGNSAIMECILNKNMRMIDFLLKNNAKIDNALEAIISTMDIDILKMTLPFLKNSINKPTSKGLFILNLCISYNYPQAISYIQSVYPNLIKPNVTSKTSPHPLHFIFTQKINEEVLIELLKLPKMKLNIPDDDNNTPLIKAVQNKYLNVVDILSKDQRCDIDKYNGNGMSALYIAVVQKDIEIIKILIRNGALVDQPISNGETPLSAEIKDNEHSEISDLLIENGASIERWSNVVQNDILNVSRSIRSTTIKGPSLKKVPIQRRFTQFRSNKHNNNGSYIK